MNEGVLFGWIHELAVFKVVCTKHVVLVHIFWCVIVQVPSSSIHNPLPAPSRECIIITSYDILSVNLL